MKTNKEVFEMLVQESAQLVQQAKEDNAWKTNAAHRNTEAVQTFHDDVQYAVQEITDILKRIGINGWAKESLVPGFGYVYTIHLMTSYTATKGTMYGAIVRLELNKVVEKSPWGTYKLDMFRPTEYIVNNKYRFNSLEDALLSEEGQNAFRSVIASM